MIFSLTQSFYLIANIKWNVYKVNISHYCVRRFLLKPHSYRTESENEASAFPEVPFVVPLHPEQLPVGRQRGGFDLRDTTG